MIKQVKRGIIRVQFEKPTRASPSKGGAKTRKPIKQSNKTDKQNQQRRGDFFGILGTIY